MMQQIPSDFDEISVPTLRPHAWGLLIGVLGVFLLGPRQVDAGPFELAFDKTNYAAPPGGTIDVDLIFRDLETDPTGFDLEANGLRSGGGRILQTAGPLAISIGSESDISPNPGFSSDTKYPFDAAFPKSDPGNVAGLLESTFFPVGVGSDSVVLGTFTLTVNGDVGETATITPKILGGGVEGNVGDDGSMTGVPLDSEVMRTPSSTVTATPEPTSIGIFGMGAFLLGGYGWCRRKRS